MSQSRQPLYDSFLTSLAPIFWGGIYVVTTELLPASHPVTIALLRALPAGLLLLLITRKMPKGIWIFRSFILGFLNFSLFFTLLFIAAFRLPGGVAAVLNSTQPLMIVFLSSIILKTPIRFHSVMALVIAIAAVALLVLTPDATLDFYGVLIGLACAVSLAFGMVLSKLWQPPVSALTFAAWQLSAGGLLLLPIAFIFEPTWPPLTSGSLLGYLYLCIFGAAISYILWFRGIIRLGPATTSVLGFLSPVTAFILGWLILSQSLTNLQFMAIIMIVAVVFIENRLNLREKLMKK